MRRIILLVVSIALLAGGAYLLLPQLVCLLGFARQSCAVRGWGFVLAGFLTFLGSYLLWDDFVRPWLSRSDKQWISLKPSCQLTARCWPTPNFPRFSWRLRLTRWGCGGPGRTHCRVVRSADFPRQPAALGAPGPEPCPLPAGSRLSRRWRTRR